MSLKIERLKIFEQLLIVFVVAVLLPLSIDAFIITNVNQHAIRRKLNTRQALQQTAFITAYTITSKKENKLFHILPKAHIKSQKAAKNFLHDVISSSNDTLSIEIVDKDNIKTLKNSLNSDFQDNDIKITHDIHNKILIFYAPLKNNKYIKEIVDIKKLEKDVFSHTINDKRQIYVIDSHKNIVMAYNREDKSFKSLLLQLPKQYTPEKFIYFGKTKNQPTIFLNMKNPDWSIIVVTPRKLVRYSIITARYKILLALIVAAIAIIVAGAWYSFSLRTNLKQLFKAITAVEKEITKEE